MKLTLSVIFCIAKLASQAQHIDVPPPAEPVLEWLQGCSGITSSLEPYASVMDYACVEKAMAFCEIGGNDDASRACRVGLSNWYAAEVARLLKGLSGGELPEGFQRDRVQRRLDELRGFRMDGCSDDRLAQACAEFAEGVGDIEACPKARVDEMCELADGAAAWLETRTLRRGQ